MFEKTSNTLKNTMSVQISKGDASFLPSFFFRSERKRKKRADQDLTFKGHFP